MKYIFLLSAVLFSLTIQAQNFGNILKKKLPTDSAKTNSINKLLNQVKGNGTNGLTQTDVINGLKEALTIGAEKTTQQLSAVDGFLGNAAIKILLPPEATIIEQKLRGLGMNKQVDDAITSMNRAAEDAAKTATPIFVSAVKNMSITDAFGILKGSDSAATTYLRNNTTKPVTDAFRPVIEQSLVKVNATKYWNTLITNYNKFSIKKINPDLAAYVTEKAMVGIYQQIAMEEKKIRKDPLATGSALLQKVFGSK